MKADYLNTPKIMNMGFHYTLQYSRRTRVNVMGLVDHSTEEWERWYRRAHELESLQDMADAGYKLIEIHYLYGFGIKSEKDEIALTKKMVENAHKVGIKVLGYFQFFSVQKELFFLENPWAKDCVAVKHDGTPHQYAYDRPALCFTNEKVRKYYKDGVTHGLTEVGLDGIRFDNDYYRGCYCEKCQKKFVDWLKNKFPAEKAKRVFGYENLEGVELVPQDMGKYNDPLKAQTIYFRQWQRQEMFRELLKTAQEIKPDVIIGGNPAIVRLTNNDSHIHNYLPDLGETHHIVCAENSLFPARADDTIRHQTVAYKHAKSNDFKIFASHHLYEEGALRWPDTNEAALSLYEALGFGGHVPCTTWGIRMDGVEDKTLWQRPEFLKALTPVKEFINKNEDIYNDSRSNVQVGIYLNRECMAIDYQEAWYSLNGMIQALMLNQIPFRFVDTDEKEKLTGLDLLIIPSMRMISNDMLNAIKEFASSSKVILTGESGYYDEYFLKRKKEEIESFIGNNNIIHLPECPEKVNDTDIEKHGKYILNIPAPKKEKELIECILSSHKPEIKISGSRFIGVDTFENTEGRQFIHLLNYDNNNTTDINIEILTDKESAEVISPNKFGCKKFDISKSENTLSIKLKELHTYAVICL